MTRLSELANLIRVRLDVTPAEAQRLVDCVTPVLVLDDVAGLADPTGSLGRLAMGFVQVGGVAAERGHVQLFNPAGSGMLLSATLVIPGVGPGGSGNYNFGVLDVALATLAGATATTFVDRREPGNPVGQIRSDTNIGFLFNTSGSIRILEPGNSGEVRFPNPVILEPGQGICGASAVNNVTVDGWWFWRESKRVRA